MDLASIIGLILIVVVCASKASVLRKLEKRLEALEGKEVPRDGE